MNDADVPKGPASSGVATETKAQMGRPALAADLQSKVLGELGRLTPRTPEYRRKRRELAQICDMTERGIDAIFARLRAHIVESTPPKKEMGPLPSTESAP